MNCTFKIPSGSTWAAFGTVVQPFKFGRKLGDTNTGYNVILSFSTDTAALKPGQIAQLDFGSSYIEYIVIVDGGSVSRKGASSYKHQYVVQELICIFRETHIQTAFFTGTAYATPAAFFTRLFALVSTPYTLGLSSSFDRQILYDNWQQADYQVASNSFLDNLVKIGLNNQVRFKAFYTPSTNTVSITVHSLLGSSTISSITGTQSGETTQYLGTNYAGRVSAIVSNVASDQFKWWPTYSFVSGARGEPSDQYETETSEGDIVIVCSHNIRSARKVRVVGYANTLTRDSQTPEAIAGENDGNDYKYYDRAGTEITPTGGGVYVAWNNTPTARNTFGYISEFNVVEYREWLLLAATGTGSQADTLYYKRGENKIYNVKVCNGLGTSANSDWIYEKRTWNGSTYVFKRYRYQGMYYQRNFYSVEASFYNDGEIQFYNDLNSKRTAFYSQEENQAAGKNLLSNMTAYIDSMKNGEYELSYIFDSYANIPALGGIYNGMVLYQIEMELHQAYIAASLKFSDDVAGKSEYLSADDGLNLPAIPLDKAFDRFTNYQTNVWLCATQAQAQEKIAALGVDTYFDQANYADDLLDGFENRTNSAPIPLQEAQLRTGDGAPTYVYTAGQTMVAAINGSLIVNFRTIDNSIIGRKVDEGIGTDVDDLRFYPVAFINSTGIAQNLYLKIKVNTSQGAEANYPAISAATFNSDTGAVIKIDDANYYHDPAERINIMVQVNMKLYGNTGKVYQPYLEETQFFRDTFFESEIYSRKCRVGSTDFVVSSVTCSNVTTGIYLVKIYLTGYNAVSASDSQFVTFKRVNLSTSAEETMLEGIASRATAAGDDYVAFYVAFTK